MSSDYERWQVSLLLLLLPFMPLEKHSARVISPKDIYMVDLDLFLVHCCTDCSLSFILEEFDNLIWVCAGKGTTLGELLDRPVIFVLFIITGAFTPDPHTGKQSLWKWHQVPAAVLLSIFKALIHFSLILTDWGTFGLCQSEGKTQVLERQAVLIY